jgi:hypothetical protein
MGNKNLYTLLPTIASGIVLLAHFLGYNFVSDQQVNTVVDGVLAVVSIVGGAMSHIKNVPVEQAPANQ